ncbi:hypothetical protein CO086_01780 [Candidatus Uhrbacteria bacterium CG_4_9_14_0_8_um_filter_41_16]|nr:MAG: hypothetical protein CO086_01780 [Candidatus Uhrbacteria bacterium CG_4_9_14_0_8_um_filter_41_16]
MNEEIAGLKLALEEGLDEVGDLVVAIKAAQTEVDDGDLEGFAIKALAHERLVASRHCRTGVGQTASTVLAMFTDDAPTASGDVFVSEQDCDDLLLSRGVDSFRRCLPEGSGESRQTRDQIGVSRMTGFH